MENAYNVKVSDRANLVRTIMMECQRLTSHLLALGHTAEALGYENLFMQFFREREEIMMLVNRVSGNRVHYSMNTIGGLRKDVTYEQLKDIEKTMDVMEPKFLELQKVIRNGQHLPEKDQGYRRAQEDGRGELLRGRSGRPGQRHAARHPPDRIRRLWVWTV